jgi:hypothetical protein
LYHVRHIQTNKVRRLAGSRLKHVLRISKISIKAISLSTKQVLNQKLMMVAEDEHRQMFNLDPSDVIGIIESKQ